MSDPNDDEMAQAAAELAQGMLMMGKLLEPLLDGTAGYYARCKAFGFDNAAAGSMAADYHRLVATQITSRIAK